MTGEMISHYRVLEQLGAGGMGVVYRAHDEQLQRYVALKVLSPKVLADESATTRFRREALALSQLNHPNICTIYEFGEANGDTYIVMEFIDGRPLNKLIPGGGLAIETTLRYGTEIAGALSHAHKLGLLHRDIKTSNVLITKDGRAKLLDFGLAKQLELRAQDATLSETLTQAGSIAGTLAYMAPEILSGGQADERSDIWALGVVLHEMIAGSRPFEGTSEYTLVSVILREPAPPLPEHTPPGLRAIINKCLAKEPAQRYQSAAEVASALEAVSSSPAAPPPTAKRFKYGPVVLAALALLILAVWLGPQLKQLTRSPGRIQSIAVLPFENRSTEADQEFFADGMTEQLITDLSKIRALRVISRNSIMRYRGTNKRLADIAKELGVDVVVVGSVMRSADKIRIAAQLIEARGDQNLWAESYDRQLSEMLALQREVARNIANEIRITVTPIEQARLSSGRHIDSEVHQLVLRGQYFANKGSESNLRQALEYFEQASAKDPNYAPAFSGAAFVYKSLATVHAAPREVMPKARLAAEKALELDETLADAHVSLAEVLLFYEWDWPQAEIHLKRALELSPSSADAHLLYASFFGTQGRSAEALTEIRAAQRLDPLSVPVQVTLLFALVSARKYDEAIEQAKKLVQQEPNVSTAYVASALAHGEKGEFVEAIDDIEKAEKMDGGFSVKSMKAHVLAAKGDRKKAEQLLVGLKEISSRRYVCAYEVAHTYVKLGDKKEAFEWLEKGKRDRADCMVWLLAEPWMDPLRGDSRYKELIKDIGLGTGHAGQKP